MKKTIKSIFATVLASITVLGSIPAFAADNGVTYSDDGKVLIRYSQEKTDKKFTVPDGVKEIDEAAFAGNKYLEEVIFPDSLETIRHAAFNECTALRTVTLAENVSVFRTCDNYSGGSFCGCPNLEAINVDEDNDTYKSVDGVVFTKDGKELVYCPAGKKEETYNVPEGTEIIGWNSFCEQKHIKNIVIPEGVTTIEGWAISSCGLETISIPESMKEIGWSAIDGCDNLRTVYYAGNIKEFDGIDISMTDMGYDKDNVSLFEAELICEEKLPFFEGLFYSIERFINKMKFEIKIYMVNHNMTPWW